jgi:hypothetical protein
VEEHPACDEQVSNGKDLALSMRLAEHVSFVRQGEGRSFAQVPEFRALMQAAGRTIKDTEDLVSKKLRNRAVRPGGPSVRYKEIFGLDITTKDLLVMASCGGFTHL